jgi:hypothetical protein
MADDANKVHSTTPSTPNGVVPAEKISPEVRSALSEFDGEIRTKVLDVVSKK